MTAPAQDLSVLPWRSEMPDASGLWWFTFSHALDGHPWAEHVNANPERPLWLNGYADHGEPIDITPEVWKRDGFRCCPVVVLTEFDAVLAASVVANAADRCGNREPTDTRDRFRHLARQLWAMSGEQP